MIRKGFSNFNYSRFRRYAKKEKEMCIIKNFFESGLAYKNGITVDDVDPKQLKMGIDVEMEHTDHPKIAEKIALDHLTEDPEYYTKLKKMEEGE